MQQDIDIGRMILDFISSKNSTEKIASNIDLNEAKKISEGLFKIASYPYNKNVYGSIQEIMKIASKCISSLLQTLQTSNLQVVELEKSAEIRCLLSDMIKNGLVSNNNLEEKIAELMKKDDKNLLILKEAIKLANNKESESLIFEQNTNEGSKSRIKRGIFDGIL
jgi:hypothetical protein